MKKKSLKYTVSIATLAVLMQSTPVFASPITQGQINSTQGQIQATELEIENLNTQIQQIDDEIIMAMDKSQKLNDEIKTQQEKVEKTKVEIEETQKSLDAHRNVYSGRLQALQLQGQSPVLTYAEILFSSNSLSDFIHRATAVSTILESDADLMDGLKDKEQELMDAKEKLDNQLKELKEKQDQLASEQATIEVKKQEIQSKLAESTKALEKQQAELSKQQAQLQQQEKEKEQVRVRAKEQARVQAQQETRLTQPSVSTFHAPKVSFNNVSNLTHSSDKATKVIEYGKQFRGVPYVWGGTTPNGFDCSGFTSYVFRNAVGIELPRVSRDQQNAGTRISPSQVQPGDLVFKGYPAYHVGIYIGGGKYIHAPQTGDVVKIASYNPSSFSTASRILK